MRDPYWHHQKANYRKGKFGLGSISKRPRFSAFVQLQPRATTSSYQLQWLIQQRVRRDRMKGEGNLRRKKGPCNCEYVPFTHPTKNLVFVQLLSSVQLFAIHGLQPARPLSPWVSQAGILEWVAISFSRGSSLPRNLTRISCTAGGFFTTEPPGKPLLRTWVQRKPEL